MNGREFDFLPLKFAIAVLFGKRLASYSNDKRCERKFGRVLAVERGGCSAFQVRPFRRISFPSALRTIGRNPERRSAIRDGVSGRAGKEMAEFPFLACGRSKAFVSDFALSRNRRKIYKSNGRASEIYGGSGLRE